MKLHRFYAGDQIELDKSIWINDKDMIHQWKNVLRFRLEQEVVLFNHQKEERLYRITKLEDTGIHLELVTEMAPKTPDRDIYLCFSILKKDKVEWVLQKATELGVRHFVPIMTNRTEKTGFNQERAEKIVIEAAEQCGRADIPSIREPINLDTAINELEHKVTLLVAEQGSDKHDKLPEGPLAVFVGPEGGWNDEEKKMFADREIQHIRLSEFTLRAETACITAVNLCIGS